MGRGPSLERANYYALFLKDVVRKRASIERMLDMIRKKKIFTEEENVALGTILMSFCLHRNSAGNHGTQSQDFRPLLKPLLEAMLAEAKRAK